MRRRLFLVTAVVVAGSCSAGPQVGELDEVEGRLALPTAVAPTEVATAGAQAAPARSLPDPARVYAVPVTGDPVRGNPDALVTVIKATEYACPYCAKNRAVLDQIMAAYPNDVRIVYKDFIVHPRVAFGTAQAACAAAKQGKFLEMDALLWDNVFAGKRLDRALFERFAGQLGLDLARFRADFDGVCPGEIEADMAALRRFGVYATPMFFINGRFLAGAQPYAAFKAVIDEELAKARARVRQGTRPARYYDEWVMKRGLPGLAPPQRRQ
ncbi:MAG TPA: DsbA family protein [Kofleriaceae bacterium]|jgi:protein-disulfide isomerase|nr:DsbA family protein [Kofleriaceae bacterium]